MRYVYIDGYDVTDYIDKIPKIDINIPEYGEMSNQIMNGTINLNFPISFKSFFDNGRQVNNITVNILEDNKTLFDGVIDSIEYNYSNISILAKSYTTVLFSNELSIDYVYANAYPSDIFKQIAELANIDYNNIDYNTVLDYHKALDITFTVIEPDLSYADVLNKLAEVTCGKIYMLNNELRYEVFSNELEYPVVNIDDEDFTSYPIISQESVISTVFDTIDVKFGANLLIHGTDNATKTIDMSNDSIIQTSNLITATHIADSYNELGKASKYTLTATLRENLKEILYDFNRIQYNNRVYQIINLNQENNNDINIFAESIERLQS